MHKLFKVPLLFLFVASCIGLFLRYQLIAPIEGIVYSFVLHAHSHVMFLGWVFNVLILGFAIEFAEIKRFRILFWFLQCCVIGMLISFPLQGYGKFSIAFSTLHTLGAYVYCARFLRETKNRGAVSLMLARAALLFFVLASLGPFLLGYLKANGLDHSNLYRFSIYFYLHFQYNGFFFFGALSLFIKLFEDKLTIENVRNMRLGGYICIYACLPAYLLSVLWSQPSLVLNIIGLIAAVAQFIGVYFLLQPLSKCLSEDRFKRQEKVLFSLSFISLAIKLTLQVFSAVPAAAIFANEFRAIVIAYLHLALLGFITFLLVAWLMNKQVIQRYYTWAIPLVVSGFVLSEVLLIISPWNDAYFHIATIIYNCGIFLTSLLIVGGIALLLASTRSPRH